MLKDDISKQRSIQRERDPPQHGAPYSPNDTSTPYISENNENIYKYMRQTQLRTAADLWESLCLMEASGQE